MWGESLQKRLDEESNSNKGREQTQHFMIHEPEVKCDYFETMDIEIQLSKVTTSLRVTEIKDKIIKRLLFNDKFQVNISNHYL